MIQVEMQGCDATDLVKVRLLFAQALGAVFKRKPAISKFFQSFDEALRLEQESRQLFGYKTTGRFMIECELSILSNDELKFLRNHFEQTGSAFVPIKLCVGALLLDIASALADELSSREHA